MTDPILNIAGIRSNAFPGEDRDLLSLEVFYNDEVYGWEIFVDPGTNLGEFVANNTTRILGEIDAKELEWTNLNPKTREITDIETGTTTTIPIEKGEIVRADIPDYVAKRRSSYPAITDQIGALINPNSSPSLAEIQATVATIKDTFKPIVPKPVTHFDVYTEMDRRLASGFTFHFQDSRGAQIFGTTESDMRGWNEVTTWALLETIQAMMKQTAPTGTLEIKTETGKILINPLEWFAVLATATQFRQPIWNAGFTLNAMNPIPLDYKNDSYWV